MVTIHQMPPKNQFPAGISCGFDNTADKKAPLPNALPDFTSDCLYDDYGKESCQKNTSTRPGIRIIHHSPQPATPAPGHQIGHDNAHIAAFKNSSALQPPGEFEHKVVKFVKDKMNSGKRKTDPKTRHNLGKGVGREQSPVDHLAEVIKTNEEKTLKSDRFM